MGVSIQGAIGVGTGGVDLMVVPFGTGNPAWLAWDTSDANANMLKLQLPAGGAVDVPVFWMGTSIYGVDLAALNGVTDPTLVISSNTTPSTDYVTLSHDATSAHLNVVGGTLSLDIAGTAKGTLSATALNLLNDIIFSLGTGGDVAMVESSAGVAANTALTSVLIGTPVAAAVAADSLLISNTTASGDIAIYVNKGGHSQQVFWADASAGDTMIGAPSGGSVDVYIAGTKQIDYAAGALAFQQSTTISAAAGTLTINAFTLGGAITGGGNAIVNAGSLSLGGGASITSVVDNSFVSFVGGSGAADSGARIVLHGKSHAGETANVDIRTTDAAGTGEVNRLTISGVVATATATWASIYHVGLKFGLAGTATGAFTIDGATSGVVTVTVAAAAGTWTLTLPAAVGGAGQQLTDAAGNGITSWAAAGSVRSIKDIRGVHDAQDALDKILGTKVYDFHYKDGEGTLDTETDYVGVVADEAPWAMHYQESIVNPVNTFGYTVLAFQALNTRIKELEAEVTALKGAK